jgi:flagellar hook-length control protein FliK
LGRVSIVLTATAEGTAIRIRAENETVRGLLAAHAAEWQADLKSQGVSIRSLDVTGGTLAGVTGDGARRAGADARQEDRREEDSRRDDGRVVPLARFRAARGAPAYEEAPPPADAAAGVDLRA